MEKKRLIKTGIFFVAVVVIFVWGINFLKNKNVFSSDSIYYGVYNDVKGLTVSSYIYMNGLQIGNVRAIKFKNDNTGKLVTTFRIDNKIKLPSKSIFKIVSFDLMGTKAINVVRAPVSGGYHKDRDTVKTSIEEDLMKQVNREILPLKNKTEKMIKSIDSVLIIVKAMFNNKTRNSIKQSFENIRITLKNLASASEGLDTLISSQSSRLRQIIANAMSITTNLKNNNERITTILTNFSNISDSLGKSDIVSIVRNAGDAVRKFNKVMSDIDKGKGTIGLLLKDSTMYNNLESASVKLNSLLDDIEKNPKRYITFSAFDFGRTVIIDKNGNKIKKKKKNKK